MDRALPSLAGIVCLLLLLEAGEARASEDAPTEGEGAEREELATDEIIVEGKAVDRADPGQTPAALTVIEVDERVSAADDVAELLDTAPGATVQRLGGLADWSGVSLRGAQVRHTLVCLDGVPLNPDGAGSVNLSELPLSAISELRVYRGGGPPELGGSPMGGVVDLITAAEGPPAYGSVAGGSFTTGKLTGGVRQSGQLWGRETETLVLAEALSTRGDFAHFSDNGTEYQLLDDRVTERANNDKAQLSAHGRWTLRGPGWTLQLLDGVLGREEGLPGHAAHPTEDVRLETRRNLAVARVEAGGGGVSGEVRGWSLWREETLDDREGEIGTGNQWQTDHTSSWGVLGHLRWAARPWLVPALTLDGRRDGFRRQDLLQDATEPAQRRSSAGMQLSAELYLWEGRVLLTPSFGVRALADAFVDPDELDADETSVATAEELGQTRWQLLQSPGAGLLLRPVTGVALKANLSRGWRPPDFTELFGDRGAVLGNPDLEPERGLQTDVALRLTVPAVPWLPEGTVEIGVFRNAMEDQIVLVQNSQRTMVPVNLEDGLTRGVEGAVALTWWGWLDTQSSLTLVHSEDRSSDPAHQGNQLPRIPAVELSQRTTLLRPGWLRVGHHYSFTDGNYWDRTNYYRAAPRSLHGAFVRVEPGTRGAISAELSVLNLLDRTVEVVPRNPLDPDADDLVVQPLTDFTGYPLPGRTVMVTVRWAPSPAREGPGYTP